MSKVKLLNLLVVLALLLSYPLSSITTAQAAPVSSEIASEIDSTEQPDQALALPTIYDFESGMPSGYFADPGGEISASVVTTDTLGQMGVITNHVLAVNVVTPRAWAGLQGFNLPATQDWSAYDGVSFWFKGTNSGKTFLYAITQGGGAGLYQASFTDNTTGWKYISLPWEAFTYREGATGTPTFSLTSVTAYFIQFSDNGGDTGFSGTFYLDQMKLFDNTINNVYDFEAGMPSGYFADPGGEIAASVMTTATLGQAGVITNHVLAVSVVTPRAWAGLQGFNLPAPQDWSAYDGVSFWFKGTNSGKTFLYAITQGGGAGLYQASFIDNTTGWKLVSLPWQVFTYREGATGTPTFSLTSVTAYFIQFSDNGGDTGFAGTFYLDQMRLFDTDTTNVYDFESGMPSGYFADPGGEISASVVTTNALSQLGVITNHVLAVSVVTPRAWAGLQGFNLPAPQDWSAYDGVSFWFKGTNSGKTFLYAITQGGGAGLYQAAFTDNTTGWKLVNLPWPAFTYREGATGTPTFSLTSVTAYFIQFSDNGGDTGFSGAFYLDQMAVYGPAGTFYIDQIASPLIASSVVWQPSKVAFSQANYTVDEGAGSAIIDVSLETASTVPVTVSYMTQGGTALPDVDYTPVSGTLVFAPAVQVLTFTVPITDNVQYAIFKTVGLSLTDVISGEIGALNPATLIINDNDSPDIALVDNFEGGLTTGRDSFNNSIGYSTWGSTANNVMITVTSGMTLPGGTLPNHVLKVTSNIENWGGFTNAFADDQSWGHQDWSRYDGLRFWFYGTNSGKQIQIEIFDNRQLENTGDSAERYYQRFADNFSGWQLISLPFALFQRRSDFQPGGAPADGLNLTHVSGYAFNLPSVASETIYYVDQVELYSDLSAHPAMTRVSFSAYAYGAIEGQALTAKIALNHAATTPITVSYVITADTATAPDFTAPLSGTLVFATGEVSQTITVQTSDDHKVEAREQLKLSLTGSSGAPIGYLSRALLVIIDNDTPDPGIIDDFENGVPTTLEPSGTVTITTQSVLATDPLAVPGQDPDNNILHVTYDLPAGTVGGFDRKFDAPQDLSQSEGLSFWYYGSGSGQVMTVTLLDNGQPDPGPTSWTLAWSDEFSGSLGAAPNPANWNYDIDGRGWGNNEWQYYTDSRDNSALDGNGHLVISAITNTNPAYTCTSSSPTGPGGQCYATSARLLSAGKQEFAYGRVEARLKIPKGQGIWPAFWMLGNDIFTTNPWPASGEIDIMENIGKVGEQTKVYGTIHGPGYSGGSGIGSSYDVTPTVLADEFHVYAIEWEPTQIRWYLDGTNYFTATNTMIPAGTEWVFDHPFFIIMNIAVGGNWPGYPDATTLLPQTMTVDYVRVYQAPDTAERFEVTFVDNTAGWKKVTLPFSAFKRSATQPAGAPQDGLTLTAAQGYGFKLAGSANAPLGSFYLDDIRHVDLHSIFMPIIRR